MTLEPIDGHAFISYVHEDSDQVDALEAFLEASGIHVWRDKNQLWPGDEWNIEIRRAIQRNALGFIACFSEASTAKDRSYQNEELILATEEYRLRRPGRPWLFPFRFDDVEPPPYDLGAGRRHQLLRASGGVERSEYRVGPSIFNQTSLFCNPPMVEGQPTVACRATLCKNGRLTDLGTLGARTVVARTRASTNEGRSSAKRKPPRLTPPERADR